MRQGIPQRSTAQLRLLGLVIGPVMLTVLLDWVTKAWAVDALSPHRPVPVISETFRLTLGYNSGTAFGLFAAGGVLGGALVLIVTGFIIVVLTLWVLRALRGGRYPLLVVWLMGLLIGGSIANFVDRLPDGRVTDFLDFGLNTTRWPAFNLADAAISVGAVGLLFAVGFRMPRSSAG